MGTITSLLQNAETALSASQTAINTTANNISNQNTAGYARQTVSFTARDYVTVRGASQGTGVSVAVLTQRDRVLDQRVQQSTQSSSAADARLTALQQLESIFNLNSSGTSDVSGLGSAINTLYSSLTSLQADPSSTTARQAVLTAAQSFASTVQMTSSQLKSQQSQLGQEVATATTTVNSLLAQIADVNTQMANQPASADTSGLEAQRQALLTSLSQYVDFQQISTDHNGISLATADGTSLVAGGIASSLTVSNQDGILHVTTNSGQDITSSITGGAIGGWLQVNNSDIPSVMQALDSLTFSVATSINATNAAGTTLSGTAGGDVFSIPASADGASSSISVALTNPNDIAASALGEGVTGSGNTTQSYYDVQTATNALSSLLANLGSVVSSATSSQTVASSALTQATSQRDAFSGVSLDEEAANLTQYQRSYEAAAKVFSIVNDLLAAAINLGTPTTVA